jgi:RNA polymerase-binding transcription factor DksA
MPGMKTISDDDLRDARDKLLTRGAELRDRLSRVRLDLSRAREPLPHDFADAAIAVENDEVLQAIEQSAVRELHHIDHALQRIDGGTFAQCEKCGEPIDRQRLLAVPYTTLCLSCAKES